MHIVVKDSCRSHHIQTGHYPSHPGMCSERSLGILKTLLLRLLLREDPNNRSADRSPWEVLRWSINAKIPCQILCLDLREQAANKGIGGGVTVHMQLFPWLLMLEVCQCNPLSLQSVYAVYAEMLWGISCCKRTQRRRYIPTRDEILKQTLMKICFPIAGTPVFNNSW